MAKIKAPVEGHNGTVGPVRFVDGEATTDNEAVIAYCRDAGYTVDGDTTEPLKDETRVDARDAAGEVVVGTRLRDASTDPRPEDFLPPTNAGKADPHGPLVVAPGIHAIETQVVRPGPVSNDVRVQEQGETAQATALLVKRLDVRVATAQFTPGSDTGPLGLSDPGSVAQAGDAGDKDVTQEDVAAAQDEDAAGSFDPAAHTVDEVNSYLAGEDDDERTRVLALEADAQGRKGIVDGPHAPKA